jgi:predicted Holliday junction resolvase-like endonuclease
VFTPKGLSPDDAKVIFNPIDYIVFNGMNGEAKTINNIVLLDRERTDKGSQKIQRSIEKAVESGNYEWKTIRINDDGELKYK